MPVAIHMHASVELQTYIPPLAAEHPTTAMSTSKPMAFILQ